MSSSVVCQRFPALPGTNLADPLPEMQNSPPVSSEFPLQSHENEPETNKKTETQLNVNGDSSSSSGGWSFQFLVNPSQKKKESNEKENFYVHPLAKRSASALSKGSLEICTESLGSETGSESVELSSLSSRRENLNTTQRPKSRELVKQSNFPPPLTSISGLDSVKVRPHREGGRLVIEAVTISSCRSIFQSERAGDRLRLCLVKSAEEEDVEIDGVAECEEECCPIDEEKWVEEVGENSVTIGSEGENDCEINDEQWEGGSDANSGEIGIGESHWPSRCYESGFGFRSKGIQSLGPVWVAIS